MEKIYTKEGFQYIDDDGVSSFVFRDSVVNFLAYYRNFRDTVSTNISDLEHDLSEIDNS